MTYRPPQPAQTDAIEQLVAAPVPDREPLAHPVCPVCCAAAWDGIAARQRQAPVRCPLRSSDLRALPPDGPGREGGAATPGAPQHPRAAVPDPGHNDAPAPGDDLAERLARLREDIARHFNKLGNL